MVQQGGFDEGGERKKKVTYIVKGARTAPLLPGCGKVRTVRAIIFRWEEEEEEETCRLKWARVNKICLDAKSSLPCGLRTRERIIFASKKLGQAM